MLIVVQKGREADVEKVFDKWDLNCAIIGEVIEGDHLRYYMHGELCADVPADVLVLGGGAPIYKRDYKEPAYIPLNKSFDINTVPIPEDLIAIANKSSGIGTVLISND